MVCDAVGSVALPVDNGVVLQLIDSRCSRAEYVHVGKISLICHEYFTEKKYANRFFTPDTVASPQWTNSTQFLNQNTDTRKPCPAFIGLIRAFEKSSFIIIGDVVAL